MSRATSPRAIRVRQLQISLGLTVVAALLGCGGDGTLTLRLVGAGCEDPFAGLDQYRVQIFNTTLGAIEQVVVPANKLGAELSQLAPTPGRRVQISGLRGTQLVARGETRVIDFTSGEDLEELIPFSTPQVAVALPQPSAHTRSPTPDGSLNEWRSSPSLILDGTMLAAGDPAPLSDLRAELFLAWEADRLHFALRVLDDCPALRAGQPTGRCAGTERPDRLAIGLDGTKDGGDYGKGDFWLEIQASAVVARRGQGLTASDIAVAFALLPNGAGWTVEGWLKLSALGRAGLQHQDRIGFDLVLYDEDPGQAVPTTLRWSTGSGSPDQPTPIGQLGTIGFAQAAP